VHAEGEVLPLLEDGLELSSSLSSEHVKLIDLVDVFLVQANFFKQLLQFRRIVCEAHRSILGSVCDHQVTCFRVSARIELRLNFYLRRGRLGLLQTLCLDTTHTIFTGGSADRHTEVLLLGDA
jgi:hypothetical protein